MTATTECPPAPSLRALRRRAALLEESSPLARYVGDRERVLGRGDPVVLARRLVTSVGHDSAAELLEEVA